MKNLILLNLLSFSILFNLQAQENITYVDLTVETSVTSKDKDAKTAEVIASEEQALMKEVRKSMVYPNLAEEYNIEGMVVLRLTFNGDETMDVKVKKSLGFGCDKVAIKTAQRYAAEFRQVYDKADGPHSVNIPFRFSLQ